MKQSGQRNFPLLFILLALAACGGGQKTSSKLEVSSSFMSSNTGFAGGLIINGDNGKDTFSVSLTNGTSTTLELDKGTWRISAIGWDGGEMAPARHFAGKAYCGSISKSLVNDTETIQLNVSQEGCTKDLFSAGHVDTAASPSTLKNLGRIITCNSFFKAKPSPTDTLSGMLIDGSTEDNYCENLDNDLRGSVRGVRITSLVKEFNSIARQGNLETGCLASHDTMINPFSDDFPINPYAGRDLRLPYNTIPLMIHTYSDLECTKPVARYEFSRGLTQGNPQAFDHKLTNSISHLRLHLPGNDLRKGTSPFMAAMPYFHNYYSNTPGRVVTSPVALAYDFHAVAGENTFLHLRNVGSCDSPSFPTEFLDTDCSVGDEGVHVSFRTELGTPSDASFSINGLSYSVYLTDPSSYLMPRHRAQGQLQRYFGFTDSSSRRFFSYNNDDDDDDKDLYGHLTDPRELFSPNGAGGVFGLNQISTTLTFKEACLATVGTKEITLFDYEEMRERKHRIEIHNNPVSTPDAYFCETANLAATQCTTTFDKRMKIYDYQHSTFMPSMTFEFSCEKLIGRMENYHIDIEESTKYEDRTILAWNTEFGTNLTKQRFDRMTLHRQHELIGGNWQITGENRSLFRTMKTDTDKFEVWDYNFNSHWDGIGFTQHLSRNQMKYYLGDICAEEASEFLSDASPDSMFTTADPAYTNFLDAGPLTGAPGTNAILFNPGADWTTANANTCANNSSFAYSNLETLGANYINGNIPIKAASLNAPSFFGAFETSFFSAP